MRRAGTLFGPFNPPFADWRGRRVWVIGASYGIGAAIARDIAQGFVTEATARAVYGRTC
jgi:NAD(P)-dependent dehydrogenase (short-subunit alcohol dehydrogenase family)